MVTYQKVSYLCIDEFQNVSTFDNPVAFQKRLRSLWQRHQNVTYCLFESKRHMLLDVFTNSELLSTSQINFLKALLANEPQLFAKSTIAKYRLGTSDNITKIKKALIDKDILDDKAGILSLQDPMYAHWLKSRYFGRR